MKDDQTNEIFDASFRVIGDDLAPEKISSILGIKPSHTHKKGDPNNRKNKSGKVIVGHPYKTGIWSLSSDLPETESLEEHLSYLLEKLEPASDKILTLSKEGFRVDIYCGYFFQHGIQGGFNISPSILERMGKMHIIFSVGTYEM